jgi:hypothetical protein
MTAERMAGLVARWVRFYTRNLPAPVAERRVEEIDSDLHEHVTHERAAGVGERRIALGIASRMLRGLTADTAWRGRQLKASTREGTMRRALSRSTVRIALGVAIVLSLPLAGMLLSEDVIWSVADFVAAGVLLTALGTAIELAVRRAGSRALALGIAAFGVACAAFGEADDAPGLILLGILLIASACAIALRSKRGQALN